MDPVRIIDISYVTVPADAAAPPPPEDIKLNAMEAQWLLLPLLQHVLFFEGDNLPPFDTLVQSLRRSLSATLSTTFAPLAGKLVHLADTGDVAIRRSAASDDDDGVMFVVAESGADVRRLAGGDDEECDVRTLERLVPQVDMSRLPAPLLAVQATRLEGGGGGSRRYRAPCRRRRRVVLEARGGMGSGVPGGRAARAVPFLRPLACQPAARRRGARSDRAQELRAQLACGTAFFFPLQFL
ncbi:unnamed protein product [Urochloa humidicola]